MKAGFTIGLKKRNQYWISFLLVISVSLVCYGLTPYMGYRVVALVLLVTVSLIAISFDILPVLFAAALSAFIWDFFFIPPRFTIHVGSTDDSILLIMYFIIAMINGVLTYKIRQAEKKARLKEERANSVKLYNTILNSLSHELRTPIAAIIGATDNLQLNKHLSNADRQQLIGEISKASLRLNQQVENLLNISRLESGHIQPKADWCDVVELVYEVVRRVEENNPGRKINISMNQDLPICWIDKGMLDQVLYNLLNNAAIHTDQGSKIEIMAACHIDLLEVVIQDSGQGFRMTNQKDVFQKFSRERKEEIAGTGLGLSIVKGFTEALGGNVELKTDGSGTRFVLSFPVRTKYISIEHG
ncbi:MAG TPA: ATP-binding protein [Chitinophagaceae bacterium]|nr:ATP-binding protein [Chitinophagaceae bacterium]